MPVSESKRRWLDEQLKRLKENGISKADISRKLDILPQSLNNVLNGNRGISDTFIDALTDAYDLNHFELVSLADRLSLVIIDLQYEKIDNIAQCFGITGFELGNFTNNFVFPSTPFDFVGFIKEYPEYNYQWILTGIGERFNIDEETALKVIKQRIYEKNHPEYFPKKNELAAKRVDPQEMSSGKPAGIPLIPYAAFAGYGSESFQDLVVEDYYIVREFKDADFLLRIKGDSMSPKFAGGDVVACKLVDGLTFWQWHKIYAICTRTQGILIKRVEEYPNNPAFITCCSDNPQYKPFQIHEDEICAIALVLGAIVIE